MRQVRSKDTSPERVIRSLLHGMGFRFRLHYNRLPGRPDVVMPKYRTVVFVHGCFWHRHPGCARATTPATNQEYWLPKFDRTIERDRQIQAKLRGLGWNVLVLWECELKDIKKLAERLFAAIAQRQPAPYSHDLHLSFAAEQPMAYETAPTSTGKENRKRKKP